MAGLLTLVISFLARLVGLGRVSDAVVNIVNRIRAPIDRALDRVVNWIRERASALVQRAAGGPPQQRLNQALPAAQAVVNRFAGRRVGAVVLRPLLAAIRLRYQLTSLDVVPRGQRWAVRGAANPEGEVSTNAQVEGADGAARDVSPEVAQRWAAGLQALTALGAQASGAGFTPRQLLAQLTSIKAQFRFVELSARVQAGGWTLSARMNPIANNLLLVTGKILLLGEEHFTFSRAFVKVGIATPSEVTATSYQPEAALPAESAGPIAELKDQGVTVEHGVDARALGSQGLVGEFNVIIWNFPHTGTTGMGGARAQAVRDNVSLLDDFFESSKSVLAAEGKIAVTLKNGPTYRSWNIVTRARRKGFRLDGTAPFQVTQFPGYTPQRTIGGPLAIARGGATTYFFVRIAETP